MTIGLLKVRCRYNALKVWFGGILKRYRTPFSSPNRQRLKNDPVRFKRREKEIVQKSILGQTHKHGEKIRAVSVFSNHVHVVVEGNHEDIKSMVRKFKAGASTALRKAGFGCGQKIWTYGFDKRYCFDEKSLRARIAYVNRHCKRF